MSYTFIIAEAAACHDRDPGKAERLIQLAKEIGADACKFQWLSSAEALAKRRNAHEYISAYRNLEFPEECLPWLKERCDTYGVEFMCTVYLPEDIEVIAPLVKRFKVASFEAEDQAFIDEHKWYNKPVIISTGMGNGFSPAWIGSTILHCVSSYPTPNHQLNLAVLRSPAYHGLSDHTLHPWTGALAVAAGAQIIEFHIRLDDTLPTNADYNVARRPEEAREYVANIRLAERMLGDGIKRVMPCEAEMLQYKIGP